MIDNGYSRTMGNLFSKPGKSTEKSDEQKEFDRQQRKIKKKLDKHMHKAELKNISSEVWDEG